MLTLPLLAKSNTEFEITSARVLPRTPWYKPLYIATCRPHSLYIELLPSKSAGHCRRNISELAAPSQPPQEFCRGPPPASVPFPWLEKPRRPPTPTPSFNRRTPRSLAHCGPSPLPKVSKMDVSHRCDAV
jgi:hypothetical protein